jgi:N-acetylmuramoyl-L-alanine amidase
MSSSPIQLRLLAYEKSLAVRSAEIINLVVVHCTELPDLATARSCGEAIQYPMSGTGNSGHFYIDRDGQVEQWVDLLRTAHHVKGFNNRSIGIELINRGRYPDWLHTETQEMTEPYPEAQINGLLDLLDDLCAQLTELCWIAGHQDLDTRIVPSSNHPGSLVRRKLDPGPLFPWTQVLKATSLKRFMPGD